jgi:hypothetical protein
MSFYARREMERERERKKKGKARVSTHDIQKQD